MCESCWPSKLRMIPSFVLWFVPIDLYNVIFHQSLPRRQVHCGITSNHSAGASRRRSARFEWKQLFVRLFRRVVQTCRCVSLCASCTFIVKVVRRASSVSYLHMYLCVGASALRCLNRVSSCCRVVSVARCQCLEMFASHQQLLVCALRCVDLCASGTFIVTVDRRASSSS